MQHRDPLDGRIGEGWAGEPPNGSHVNVVIARRGSAAHAAIVGTLASPRPGHLPFLPVVKLNEVVRPVTIVINKTTIDDDAGELARLTWGAGQVGTAQGVLDCVADGTLPPEQADDLAVLVSLWIDGAVNDETALKAAIREAVAHAVRDAVHHVTADHARDLASRREEATTVYYEGA
jgi:5,6,7,8-tetrahydromethanopterin hydro-lyase